MSKELVRLPREVAEAIESVRAKYVSGCEYDLDFLSKEKYGSMGVITMFVNRSKGNMKLYFQALVNGYEVEVTPEGEVKRYYMDQLQRINERNGTDHTSTAAVIKVLSILNIKIEGVNA